MPSMRETLKVKDKAICIKDETCRLTEKSRKYKKGESIRVVEVMKLYPRIFIGSDGGYHKKEDFKPFQEIKQEEEKPMEGM